MFDNLQAGRQGNKPFSHQDIYYFCKIMNVNLSDYDVTMLRQYDYAYLNTINKVAERAQ